LPKKRKAAAQAPAPTPKRAQRVEVETFRLVSTQRPVIAGRVPQELYDRIKTLAAASGRSMSEELAWRAVQSFAWEEAHGTVKALLAESRRVFDGDLEAALRNHGYLPVRMLPQGKAWISPDADRRKLNLAIDVRKLAHDMLPGIEKALHDALGALAKAED
jgi:hypothetical protein